MYGVAIAYCVGDVAYVGYKERESKKGDAGNVPRTAFQGLASIALPYLIFHTTVHQSQKFCLKRAPKFAVIVPSVIGLAIIPLLPVCCDEPVENLLEEVCLNLPKPSTPKPA
jgi:mitochondrial fission process protein 1